jgi:hypothetical protein
MPKPKTNFLKTIAFLALGVSAGSANAAYIVGSISASGGLSSINNGTITPYSIVSQLNTLVGAATGVANTANGNYSAVNGAAALLQSLDISSPLAMLNTPVFNIGSFTFYGGAITLGPTRTSLLVGGLGTLSDSVSLTFIGTVKEAGFQDSAFTANFTGQGSCNGTGPIGPCTGVPSAAWSASISSNGGPPPALPEPASLSLFVLGLVIAASRGIPAKKALSHRD